MIIVRTSPVTGKINEREIDITIEQYADWLDGGMLHNIASHLDEDDREFMISGCTPEDWDSLFGEWVMIGDMVVDISNMVIGAVVMFLWFYMRDMEDDDWEE